MNIPVDRGMFIFLNLIALLVVLAGFVFWVWIILGIRKTGRRKLAGNIAVQISILTIIFGVLRGGFVAGIILGLFPYMAFLELDNLFDLAKFIETKFVISLAVAFSLFCFLFYFKKTRMIAFTISGLLFISSLIVTGEFVSRQKMCIAASEFGTTEFPRNNILWSIRNAGIEWQWGLHAEIRQNGKRFGWSYRTESWYEISENISTETPKHTLKCI